MNSQLPSPDSPDNPNEKSSEKKSFPQSSIVPGDPSTYPPEILALHSPLHKVGCACVLCRAIQQRAAKGLPPLSVTKRLRDEKRVTRRRKTRTAQTDKVIAMSAAISTQVAMGMDPDVKLAAKVAGIKAGETRSNASILEALERIGINSGKLAAVAFEGLDATAVKTASLDGEITDEKSYADYPTRHKYLETVLKLRGELKQDETPTQGGLILIGMKDSVMIQGHAPTCKCDQCQQAWEVAMSRNLLLSERRAASSEAEILGDVAAEPTAERRKPSQ